MLEDVLKWVVDMMLQVGSPARGCIVLLGSFLGSLKQMSRLDSPLYGRVQIWLQIYPLNQREIVQMLAYFDIKVVLCFLE